MRLVFYRIVFFLLLASLYSGNTFGQIKSNADKVIVTSVIHADTSIHVFYGSTTDTLKAINPFSVPVTYIWTKYDATKTKDQFETDTISTDSILIGYPSGGYRVKIIPSSGKDSLYIAWVFVDSLSVTIENDGHKNIKYLRYTCDYTDIKATYSQSDFIYYNAKYEKQTLPTPTFIWSIDSVYDHKLRNFTVKDSTSWLRMDTTKGMQYEKAVYKVFVKDKFGATSKLDFVNYTPIVCKAKIDTTGSHPVRDGKNSAPFTVSFLNKSKNAVKYTWKFAEKDTVKKNDTARVTHTFFETSPNDTTPYKVYLISQSLEQCVDTTMFPIIVNHGEIEKGDSLPNVFTPGGTYNKFRIYNISIRQFKFTVFSRWGKKVYEAAGPNMLDWEGWDGDIGSSKASDGIYYYVLEAMSWDRVPDPKLMKTNGKYSGFFYLFRAK